MFLIRGEKRCLAHTQIVVPPPPPGIRAVLSNGTFINVFMILTLLIHAAEWRVVCISPPQYRRVSWVGGCTCV